MRFTRSGLKLADLTARLIRKTRPTASTARGPQKRSHQLLGLVFVSGSLFVSSAAMAQDDASAPPQPAEAPPQPAEAAPPQPAASDGDQDGALIKENKVSGPKVPLARLIPEAEVALTEMRGSHHRGLELLRGARGANDAVLLTCVNDSVTSMKGILRISEDANIALQEAMATRAKNKARQEFQKITVSRKKMAQMISAAEICSGAESVYSGQSDLNIEIDTAMIQSDPYYGSPDFFFSPADAVVDSTSATNAEDDTSTAATPPPPVVSGLNN